MRNAAKVLIVDDDKSSSQMLSEVVKRMGLKPVVVNKPTDAINVVKLQTFHAAIVDVLLPKISGVELVMEFRKTKFAENPVVLVSGVFKDKNFSTDAIKKTGAVDFLFKPFGVDELMSALKNAFKDAISVERWTVQALLTRRLSTAREKSKAIEHLEQIRGADFPCVLRLLWDPTISGHLNIVNEAGEIFGVNIMKGSIADVDSAESQATGVLALISKGFLNQEDWDEFQRVGNKKFTLERLVQEGLISPHAITVAKHEQILADFKVICSADSLRLNFSLNDGEDSLPKHAVHMDEILGLLGENMAEHFTDEYLTQFYSAVFKSSIQNVSGWDVMEKRWSDPLFEGMDHMKEVIRRGGTIEECIAGHEESRARIFHCVHFLVLRNDVMFDDVSRAKDMSAMMERYNKVLEELKDRSPDKIFEYFGAPPMAQPKVVEGIFEEYMKSNHPDRLPRESSPQLIEICKKCYDLVRKAKDVMTDEMARSDLVEKKKTEGAEKQRRANELVSKGLDLLRKGQFQKAHETILESEKQYSTSLTFMIRVWAEVKAGVGQAKPALFETLRKLEALPPDDRRSAYWYMAMGLIKKQLGDQTAASFFEKAVSADTSFTEARRELSVMSTVKEDTATKKVDLLTGDITQVISQLFKRKAE